MMAIAKRLFIGAAIFAAVTHLASYPAMAESKLNLLIMGEDADEDTVPRNSRVFRRVLDEISNQLNDEGFDVFDETAVSLENFEQGRVRRTDAELIDISKSIKQPPIDVVVMFSIYASARTLSYTTKVKSRVSGRMLQVQNGRRLGNFELESPKQWNAPKTCERECLLEVVGKNSKKLASDIGSMLGEKLGYLLDGNSSSMSGNASGGITSGYTLVFEKFTDDDMFDIEEYLVSFSGYKTHRPTETTMSRTEYWYESSSDVARISRNLRKMLKTMGLRARVGFSGNQFEVKNLKRRRGS
jgi:hypothetical protein